MTQMVLDFPETTFAVFQQTPLELASSLKIAALVKWYEEGRVSQSKAAEIAGISRQEFMEQLYYQHVSPYQLEEGELEKELS